MLNLLLLKSVILLVASFSNTTDSNFQQQLDNTVQKPLYTENILLNNDESFIPDLFIKKHCVDFSRLPMGSSSVLIRSVEVDVKYSDLLRIGIEFAMNLSISEYDSYEFFNYSNKNWPYADKNNNVSNSDKWCHFNDIEFSEYAWTKKTYNNQNSSYSLDYFNMNFKQLLLRLLTTDPVLNSFIEDIIKKYSAVSINYPDDWKQTFVNELEDLEVFVLYFSQNKYSYEKKADTSYLPDEIGYIQAFIYRRIVNDGVSASNILKLIQEIKKSVKNSIGNGEYSHYKDYIINKGNLIVSVEINSILNSGYAKIIFSTKNNDKVIEFESPFRTEIKCLQENGKDYFLISESPSFRFDDDKLKQMLIDDSLNIITNTY